MNPEVKKELEKLTKELVGVRVECSKLKEKNERMGTKMAQEYVVKMGKMEEELEELRELCRELREGAVVEKGSGSEEGKGKNAQGMSGRMVVNEVRKMLPEFDPESRTSMEVEEWVDTVEELYDIDVRTLLAAIRAKWEGSILRWLQFRQKGNESWDRLRNNLVKDFKVRRTAFEVMQLVSSTKRKMGQTLVSYFLEIEALAEGKLEEDVVRTVMSGSRHAALQDMLKRGWRCEKITRNELWAKVV